jgi:hypothetical protein
MTHFGSILAHTSVPILFSRLGFKNIDAFFVWNKATIRPHLSFLKSQGLGQMEKKGPLKAPKK